MSLEEFENEPDQKTKRYILMRSITDYGMGLLYLGIGIAIFFSKQINFGSVFMMSMAAKFFAALAVIYGVWRIYRGYKKNYLNER